MAKFSYERELQLAFRLNFLTKKLGIVSYIDLHSRGDVLILKESKSNLLFIVSGKSDAALINLNCQNKRIKMNVIKISKNLLSKAVEFSKKGGAHEH